MSQKVLRPNNTVSTSGSIAIAPEGKSAHEVLNDDSDASRVEYGADDTSVAKVHLDDFELPAEAVVKSLRLRVRASNSGGDSVTLRTQFLGADSVVLPYTAESPATYVMATRTGAYTQAEINALTVTVEGVTPELAEMYSQEVYVDVTYVTQPALEVDAPTGELTEVNRPTVEWTPELDSDGGGQTHYEVKVFDKTTTEEGGFDPDTSNAVDESGELAGAGATYQVDDNLDNDTYIAYVRIAQTVNGGKHWSGWATSEFKVETPAPAAPSLTVTADADNGRVKLELQDEAGAATTEAFQLQFSHDGGQTWEYVRTDDGEGIVEGTEATVYDYEAPNGESVDYRARALHKYSGEWAASEWTEKSGEWESGDRWLKHPTNPTLNTKVEVYSYPAPQRAARRQVLQPLGRVDPVVVSDTREARAGTIVLWLDDEEDKAALDALLDTLDPLLLQMAAGDRRPDRWVSLSEVTEDPIVDKLQVPDVLESLGWTEVARP